ncbi:MAG TPA: glycosyltransferase [Allosphingosinicella sp.]|jgi:glycosyltransferase involved in cell wall biosynthesis
MLVLCPFPVGVAAGQRLKYEQYFDDWREMGFDIKVSSYMDPAMWSVVYRPGHYAGKIVGLLRGHLRRIRDLFRIRRYDLIYIFMWVTPVGTSIFERLVRRLGKRIVFDVEDNILVGQNLPEGDNPNRLARLIKGTGKARFMIAEADHVITSSPSLNDECREINRRRACTYISSSVDCDRFVPANREVGTEGVTIGWTGTYSTKMFLDLLREIFQRLAQRVDFRLKVIGNFDWSLDGVDLEVVRWTADREVEDLQSFDVGVYPLTFDEWVGGKSGLKAIQYMAFGIPTVATNVGTTPRIIRHGENGLLVETEDEWVDALERLIRDPALRCRLGEAARRDAVAKYSTKAIAADYRRVLADVMGWNE